MAKVTIAKPTAYTPAGVKAAYDAQIDNTNAMMTELYTATGAGTTGGTQVAAGTTGQRPGSPTGGTVRFNSSTSKLEFWNGAAWETVTSA